MDMTAEGLGPAWKAQRAPGAAPEVAHSREARGGAVGEGQGAHRGGRGQRGRAGSVLPGRDSKRECFSTFLWPRFGKE